MAYFIITTDTHGKHYAYLDFPPLIRSLGKGRYRIQSTEGHYKVTANSAKPIRRKHTFITTEEFHQHFAQKEWNTIPHNYIQLRRFRKKGILPGVKPDKPAGKIKRILAVLREKKV